jgi:hypothetical protein
LRLKWGYLIHQCYSFHQALMADGSRARVPIGRLANLHDGINWHVALVALKAQPRLVWALCLTVADN